MASIFRVIVSVALATEAIPVPPAIVTVLPCVIDCAEPKLPVPPLATEKAVIPVTFPEPTTAPLKYNAPPILYKVFAVVPGAEPDGIVILLTPESVLTLIAPALEILKSPLVATLANLVPFPTRILADVAVSRVAPLPDPDPNLAYISPVFAFILVPAALKVSPLPSFADEPSPIAFSYTHLRSHDTRGNLV